MGSQQDTVKALLDRHGRTFAEELGIDVEKNTPSPLFRLLCAAVLMSARISTELSTEAARSLARHGWRTPQKLAASTWEQRVKALNEALKAFKGLGDVGVDIFFREVQVAWDELRPFADQRALDAAQRLKLPKDPEKLADLAGGPQRFARLVAALVRVDLDDDYDAVRR
jgi:hypothetical protein